MIEQVLHAARIPGGAIAIVYGRDTVLARGFGYRDLAQKLPVTAQTIFPVGSTSKAFNATLLGILVDAGVLSWDAPVRDFLPSFCLQDSLVSMQATLRDLLTMRTGLPRHDWVWINNPISRAALVGRLRYVELSAGFREHFQYSNLSATVAGHIAEVVTGTSWETLVEERITNPLQMSQTGSGAARSQNVTLSYHETHERELIVSQRVRTEVIAPAGGVIQSTVEDMARWMSFNLGGSAPSGRMLISPEILAQIHSPQVVIPGDPLNAAYGMGWQVDTYNGHLRISHGGYLHDVDCEVALFPRDAIGIVSFINFGCAKLAGLLCEHAFDLMTGSVPQRKLEVLLSQYEREICDTRAQNDAVIRIEGAPSSHPPCDYAGEYTHRGYGTAVIDEAGKGLILRFGGLAIPLRHWHYDTWIAEENEMFVIHAHHPFDRHSRLLFELDRDGKISALSMLLEPTVAPIRFEKETGVA